MSLPLSSADRYALGVRARKQLGRSGHAGFDRSKCPPDPLSLLAEAERGRIAHLLEIKHQRMAASPFGFFRGAVPIMAGDLACHPNTGLTTQLCGDAHILNLGAYASFEGRLVFDINDFDETIRGPFEWDLKRLATSLILGGREAGIRRSDRHEAIAVFLREYRRRMREFAAMPVVDLARYQIHRLTQIEPMPAILRAAERSTAQKSVVRLTEVSESGGERRFKNEPPLLERLKGKKAQMVLDALGPYMRTLEPERRHFFQQYRAVDVAFKVVGTGSIGLRDYCVYFEGPQTSVKSATGAVADPLFLQIKEEPPSAYAGYLPEGAAGHTHQGHRVVDGQRAMQLTSDPFLGYTTIEGRDYLVRQLNDHKAGLDLSTLKADSLRGYADLCGEIFARGHARGGDAIAIGAYLGGSDRFDKALVSFATAYADKTEADWRIFCKSLKEKEDGRKH